MTNLIPAPSKNIMDYWPIKEYEPRCNQIRALEWLEYLYFNKPEINHYFLQAPVGAGKSLIGATFAAFIAAQEGRNNGAFVLTPQKILQQQYINDFDSSFMASVYGKGNYNCSKIPGSCEVGSLVKPRCESCPHRTALEQALIADNVVLNYTLALLQFNYTPIWGNRPLMILDECHTAEQHLTEFSASEITAYRCEKYDIPFKRIDDLAKAIEWIKAKYIPVLDSALADLHRELLPYINGEMDPSKEDIKRIREMNGLETHIDELNLIVLQPFETIEKEYVLIHDTKFIKLKPLFAHNTFHDVLGGQADRFLLMSSTILNYKGFCRDLGIDTSTAEYLDLTSEFEPENRPVYYMPVMKMNAKWKQDDNASSRKAMLQRIQDLCDMHDGENGIIHTANFEIARWLVDNLNIGQVIFHHNPDSPHNRDQVIDGFQQSKIPSLLISPSITEGLDLKNDLGRFAIFCKVPFGFLGDQWIKRRMELSKEWYQRRALIDVIQGGGRVVRSPTDYGSTYILDESWGYLYHSTTHMVPQWWRDGYLVSS